MDIHSNDAVYGQLTPVSHCLECGVQELCRRAVWVQVNHIESLGGGVSALVHQHAG